MKEKTMRLMNKVKQWQEAIGQKLLENGVLLVFCIVIGILAFAWLWNCSLEASVKYALPG